MNALLFAPIRALKFNILNMFLIKLAKVHSVTFGDVQLSDEALVVKYVFNSARLLAF